MPLDPSIIANSMTNITAGMPDASNLMAQRVQGMENIYKIETARQAAAKEEADALQKEQEAAALEALLPAYTYGIETGDIEGALNLAPADMREGLLPYVDALRGKTPEQVRAALYGSLSASPEGQAALTAIQRGQTYGIQNRQQALAERKYEQELATAGQPEPMSAYQQAQQDLAERKFAAEQEKAARIASGEEAPVQLQKGERWNPETQRVEAVPGSQTYNKQKSVQSTDYGAAKNALRELEKVKGVVSDLKNTTGYQKAMGTGVVMSNLPNIPGLAGVTGAYDFQTKYKNLKGSVATLGRAAASLQGKLGNMAVQEWKLVSDAIANLDLDTMDADVLDDQLNIIANDILRLEAQVRDAYENEWGGTQFYAPLEGGGGGTPETAGNGVPTISTDKDYDALPSGAEFIDPEGNRRRKP
jgi:hypothetical protein